MRIVVTSLVNDPICPLLKPDDGEYDYGDIHAEEEGVQRRDFLRGGAIRNNIARERKRERERVLVSAVVLAFV